MEEMKRKTIQIDSVLHQDVNKFIKNIHGLRLSEFANEATAAWLQIWKKLEDYLPTHPETNVARFTDDATTHYYRYNTRLEELTNEYSDYKIDEDFVLDPDPQEIKTMMTNRAIMQAAALLGIDPERIAIDGQTIKPKKEKQDA